MARSYGKVFASRWGNDDWRALTRDAQWLYDTLISQSRLNLAGSLDLMPTRWAQLAAGTSVADIEAALDELASARFVAVDRATEEVVIRTLVRHDLDTGRLNSNLIKGLWAAWAGIMSPALRKVVVDNLPDIIWDKSGTSAPDEAQQMRRSPRLELPVRTTRSDQRSEPAVETSDPDGPIEPPSPSPSPSPSLVPSRLSPEAAAEREPRGLPDPTTPSPAAAHDQDQPATTPDQRQTRLAAAVELLVDRELERNPTRNGNPVRHAASVRSGKLTDHHQAGHRLLQLNPTLTAPALADLLEPTPPASNGDRYDHRLDGQQQAMLDRAAGGLDHMREIIHQPTPDPDQIAKVADMTAGIRQRLGRPT